jgi:hypothetical protein
MLRKSIFSMLAGTTLFGCAVEANRMDINAKDVGVIKVVRCSSDPCNVTVKVSGTGNARTLSVDADVLEISGVHDGRIIWHLPEGYEFRSADGILFKDPNNSDDKEFYDRHPADARGNPLPYPNSGPKYHWRNHNKIARTYQYEINFYDTNGVRLHIDPAVVNQG